jgi:Fe(3+) dicitrate transport protein
MNQLGDEFNGGSVHSYGVEVGTTGELAAGPVRFPLGLGYTFQRSVFQEAFSSANPQWGDVEPGDELPYLPAHQVHVSAGVRARSWELAAAGRYSSSMRDVAGQGAADDIERTESTVVIDLVARYRAARYGELYVTVDNALDEAHITSRRPFGARPGVPRLVVLGYKNQF